MTTKDPSNEMEVILFCEKTLLHVFEIVSISPSFPDAIILDKRDSKEYKAEFEFRSSSFMEHEHDPFGCDVIICWIDDMDDSVNFPIWEISTGFIPNIFSPLNLERQNLSLIIQNKSLSRKVGQLEKQLNSDNNLPSDWRKLRPLLKDEQLLEIANLNASQIRDVATYYGVSEKTIFNWRNYAREEIEENNANSQ